MRIPHCGRYARLFANQDKRWRGLWREEPVVSRENTTMYRGRFARRQPPAKDRAASWLIRCLPREKEEHLGAQVDLVIPGTPAVAAGLRCNDLVTAVNGKSTQTADEVTAALHGQPAGTTVQLTVLRGSPAKKVTITARLEALPGQRGQPPNPKQGFVGIETETRVVYDFPINVSADVGSIGGPSDGLALAP